MELVTPSSPPPSSSGAALTVKQQRAARREQKLEKFRQQQRRARRNRTIGLISAIVAIVAIVAVIVSIVVLTPPKVSYTPGGEGATIEGVEMFQNESQHVETPVTYAQIPPAGGEHSSTWLNCGEYSEPVPNENAVHSLEHGAIWVTYDPSISAGDLDSLRAQLPSTKFVLSPFDGLPSPIVLSGWNRQLQLDSADDARIAEFFEEYWESDNAPEPGAPCTGGLDGPGKVS